MKNSSFPVVLLMLGFCTVIFSRTITLAPSGGDDSDEIQTALNSMTGGDTILLNGSFTIQNTIFLPSNIKWVLAGSIKLAGGGTWKELGWKGTVGGVSVDASRLSGIAEKNWNSTGASGIDMSGGTYDGNYLKDQTGKSIRLVHFVRVTNSRFHDMAIKKGTDDNFTLAAGCSYNECRNLVGSFAGSPDKSSTGNALTDKGHHNKWFDCIAEDCTSDGFTPKCTYSEFTRCIARRNEGPGWGMYCRIDGGSIDAGTAIDNNRFIDCEAYENKASGFSFNISSTSGLGGSIRNNFVQARCYNNQESGVRFRNKMPQSVVADNQIDILCYGNKGLDDSGASEPLAGGLGTIDGDGTPVTGITGSIIAYSNSPYDVNAGQATGCTITVYKPADVKSPVLKQGSSNSITVTSFSCTETLSAWCQQEYCRGTTTAGRAPSPASASLNVCNAPDEFTLYPNPLSAGALLAIKPHSRGLSRAQIVNSSGQVVYSRNLNNANFLNIALNKSLTSGLYMVILSADEGVITRKLLVK